MCGNFVIGKPSVKENAVLTTSVLTMEFQQRSSNKVVPKPLRATFEMPPVKLGEKGLD
jgi:hypothetical protein